MTRKNITVSCEADTLARRELLSNMVAMLAAGVTLGACDSDDSPSDPNAGGGTGRAFVGMVETAEGIIAVVVDDPASASSPVRAYVCDGRPTDAGGYALWFGGSVDEASGGLTSASGNETLQFSVAGQSLQGVVTFADGTTSEFVAEAKSDGSGIYDVTVGTDGSYDGVSLTGGSFDATITDFDPRTVEGTLTGPTGSTSEFGLFDFEERGFDTTVEPGKFVAVALKVDEYLIMAGRSGDVRGGIPGPNIIGCWDCP